MIQKGAAYVGYAIHRIVGNCKVRREVKLEVRD